MGFFRNGCTLIFVLDNANGSVLIDLVHFIVFLFVYLEIMLNFAADKKRIIIMTATQMNAEILRNMSIIAEDENLLKRAAKYLRKLVAEKQDASLMTEEEFFAKIERAEKQPGKSFASVDELDKYIRSL